MAKKHGGKEAGNYTGGGGRIFGSSTYSNDDGAGTPPAPGERGEAYCAPVPTGLGKPPSGARVYQRFRMGKKGR